MQDMERDRYLILLAGGCGKRMGADKPKQFLETGGKAILHHTMDKFASAVDRLNIVTVLPEGWREAWKDYCYTRNLIWRQTLVSGGITRFHSVRNALEKIPDGVVVAVHDGVRPLLSRSMISRFFGYAGQFPAVVPVTPCTDTLKVMDRSETVDGETRLEGAKDSHVDRERLYAAQTPQIFWSEVLKEAYRQPYLPEFTDDASVVERLGTRIEYRLGERYNIKITTPDDMVAAGALLDILV